MRDYLGYMFGKVSQAVGDLMDTELRKREKWEP